MHNQKSKINKILILKKANRSGVGLYLVGNFQHIE